MTLSDGSYRATVDRIVEGTVVLLVENEGVQLDLPMAEVTAMTDETMSEGELVEIRIESGDVIAIEPEPEETERHRKELRERFERLSERPSDDDA